LIKLKFWLAIEWVKVAASLMMMSYNEKLP